MYPGDELLNSAEVSTGSTLGHIDCEAILFDLDGTLVNSYVDAEMCWTSWAKSVGVIDRFDFPKIFGGRRSDMVLAMLPGLSPEEVAIQVERVRLAERNQTANVVPLPGATELLRTLSPNVWAIVTSNDREVALARLRAAGLPTPRVLLSADEVEHGKPDPEGLLRAAAMLGVDTSSALAIDDSPTGIDAACRAKMPSIGVRFAHSEAALQNATFVVPNVGCLSLKVGSAGLRVIAHQCEQATD